MPPKTPKQSKYWCFTLNNYTDGDLEHLSTLWQDCPDEKKGSNITYLVYGKEVSGTGTPHLQGYVEFAGYRRIHQVKAAVSERAHLEGRLKSAQQASDYCKKDGDYEEFGTLSRPRQGRRSDIERCFELIRGGSTELAIADFNPTVWCMYRRALDRYRVLVNPAVQRKDVRVLALIGAPGTGKTRYAYHYDMHLFRVPSPDLRWFDGYVGQRTVLIDDYTGLAPGSLLLQLLDIYPIDVPVKGSFVAWNPATIFLTSNMDFPFSHSDLDPDALRRRFSGVYRFRGPVDFSAPSQLRLIDAALGLDTSQSSPDVQSEPQEPSE